MAWTDERVARLSKLWAEGLSASQIAADLGGVSRNAVIGKVHRLGLSGRAKPGGNAGGRPKRTAARPTASASAQPSAQAAARAAYQPTMSRPAASAQASAMNAQPVPAPRVEANDSTVLEARPQDDDVVVPLSRKITLLELTDNTCKWPTGDPQRPGFSFCGHQTKEEAPYCEYHAKVAFQPREERRRRR